MYKYVIKRLLLMIPVLLGISFAVFFLMNLTPGTPADIIMGELATPEAKEAMNESLGWNQPFLKRYLDYIVGVFQGDFGNSYVSGLSVMKELFTRFPTTFRLALYSMILAAVVGIPVGVACAVKQYSLMDSFSTVFALVFVSIPSFWLGLLMIILFSVTNLPEGCSFSPRCPKCMEICKKEKPSVFCDGEHEICCHLFAERKQDKEALGEEE